MTPTVAARCPECLDRIFIPYTLLGAPTSCPSCGRSVVPDIPVGTNYPKTQYEMTFSDFQQLLTRRAHRSTVSELLARWFGYSIRGKAESTTVQSQEGTEIDLVQLHRQIQEDPAKQRELYQAAMAEWR